MKLLRNLALGCALALCLPAFAQFQWIDHSGRRVFSDRPPPSDIPARNIIKGLEEAKPPRPAQNSGPDAGRPAPQTVPAAATQPLATGTDRELERKKREADQAKAARQKADDERRAAIKAENCRSAGETKATLESGLRVARVNQLGERIVLSDEQRKAELKRADDIIAEDCR